ncbi:MAG TPA: glycosyltransferase family 4 protein [Desulfotomaculum sp.]|nr:MAG: glycosyl transferase family 1 [Peptococcaceae bacterium BRH_c8a]KJS76680.1 MAG: glycosyl transferase family 1 [Desulfotomaculum sp. BICA1-6]HBX23664.1 glycosyltransferase family 4 protein [Desulfotomaculum sp.]
MKIGIFTDSYRPYTSGVVRSIETFSEELQAQGHETYIFAPDYPKCEGNEHGVFRFSSIPAPTNSDFTLALPISFRLRPLLKKLDLDIIHVHSPFMLGRLGARWAKKLNLPLVFTFHTLYDQYVHYVPFGQNLTREITRKFCTDFCNNCDLVIVPTGVITGHLKSWGVASQIRVIPTGINLQNFRKDQKDWLQKKFNIDPANRIIMSVGRLGKEKNFSFIINSFKRIVNLFPDTRLILVGNGPEKEALVKQCINLGIADKVIFTGTLTGDETALAYNSAHIFAFASVTETQGLVIGEAKTAGLPVVAVRAFGVSEMVEDGIDGFLTDLNMDLFTDKIIYLLNNENVLRSMGRKAAINAEKISAHNCTNRLLDSYFGIMRNKDKKVSTSF